MSKQFTTLKQIVLLSTPTSNPAILSNVRNDHTYQNTRAASIIGDAEWGYPVQYHKGGALKASMDLLI